MSWLSALSTAGRLRVRTAIGAVELHQIVDIRPCAALCGRGEGPFVS